MISVIVISILALGSPALSAGAPALNKDLVLKRGGTTHMPIKRAGAVLPVNPGEILAGAPVSNITVTPSNVVQCGTATIAWTGAAEPVDLSIGQGGYYIGTTPITDMPSLTGGSTTWVVNQASGEDLIFQIKDASGQIGYIQNIKVGDSASGDSSCLGSSSASSSAAGGAAGGGATGAATAAGSDGGAQATASSTDSGDDDDSSTPQAATTSATSTTAPSVTSTSSTTSVKSTTKSATTVNPAVGTTTVTAPTGTATLAGANALSTNGVVSGSSRLATLSGSVLICALAGVALFAL